LRLCGAENLFSDLTLAAPQINLEAVLARDPEVILTSEPRLLAAWQAWPQLQAVKRGQVWSIPDRGLERPSLQMLKATEQLCELLQSAR
jgi:vitamin B12 transport system substrate-binding protein